MPAGYSGKNASDSETRGSALGITPAPLIGTPVGALPNKEPQAPSSISMETVAKDEPIGRNNIPYNAGGEGKMIPSPSA